MGILTFILTFFQDLFSLSRRLWNHLPQSVQDQIKLGPGLINILSQYIGQDPKLTIATIQANFTTIDLNTLYSFIAALAKQWNLTIPATLEESIVIVQNYMKQLQGSEWDRVLSGAAQLIADIATGAGTPFGVIVSVIEFVYREFFQGKDIVLASVPETTKIAA